jgi:ABC-type lipoprotein export system ATPase subunit
MTVEPLLLVQDLLKVFRHPGGDVHAIDKLNLVLKPSEFLAIAGRSGAGKSTLLHCMGGLEAPTSGSVILEGENLYQLSDARRSRLRAQKMSFVFQTHHLLPDFTALENVLLAGRLAGLSKEESRERATDLLKRVGLSKRVDHAPSELSGGESARVAVARALVNRPRVLFADEPTGNLDRYHAEEILNVLSGVMQDEAAGLVIVSHDSLVTSFAHRVLTLDDGKING